jgi:hypothetical protein
MLGIPPFAAGGATMSFVPRPTDRMKFRRDSIAVSLGFTDFFPSFLILCFLTGH